MSQAQLATKALSPLQMASQQCMDTVAAVVRVMELVVPVELVVAPQEEIMAITLEEEAEVEVGQDLQHPVQNLVQEDKVGKETGQEEAEELLGAEVVKDIQQVVRELVTQAMEEETVKPHNQVKVREGAESFPTEDTIRLVDL
jgi:hypothetical protein